MESCAIIVLVCVCVCFCVHMGGLWLLVALHFPNHQHLSLIRLHQLCMQAAQGSWLCTSVPCPRAFFSAHIQTSVFRTLLLINQVVKAFTGRALEMVFLSLVAVTTNAAVVSLKCTDTIYWCCIFSSSDYSVDGKIWNARWDVCSIFWISCSKAGMMAWEDEQFKDWKKSVIEVNISLLLKSTHVRILMQLAA